LDIYSTNEPQNAFYRRISFCLELHNEAIKALEYPKKVDKKEIIPERKDGTSYQDIVEILREEFE
jgi:26S proteasome regulatory subunit N3